MYVACSEQYNLLRLGSLPSDDSLFGDVAEIRVLRYETPLLPFLPHESHEVSVADPSCTYLVLTLT